MIDYYEKVHNLGQDKLYDEVKRVNELLFKTSQSSPIYNQLLTMLDTAQTALDEKLMIARVKDQKDAVINIGEIESTVTEPNYDKDEILNAVVTAYLKEAKDDT